MGTSSIRRFGCSKRIGFVSWNGFGPGACDEDGDGLGEGDWAPAGPAITVTARNTDTAVRDACDRFDICRPVCLQRGGYYLRFFFLVGAVQVRPVDCTVA